MLPAPTPILLATYLIAFGSVCALAVGIRRSPQPRRLLGTWLPLVLGASEIAFAIQIRTWHGRGSWTDDPDNKRFYGSWLASELWINRGLFVAGITTMLLGMTFLLAYPQLVRTFARKEAIERRDLEEL